MDLVLSCPYVKHSQPLGVPFRVGCALHCMNFLVAPIERSSELVEHKW